MRLDYCGVGTLKSGDQVHSDNASKHIWLSDYFAFVFIKESSDTLQIFPESLYLNMYDISVTYNGVVKN